MTNISWRQTIIIGVCILGLGFGLRVYDLGHNAYVADEFLDMNSAYGYFKTGEWKAWDFNHQEPSVVNENVARDERASIYKWQVAQLFRILPPTEETARLISVTWGVISLFVVFWSTFVFTKRRETALLATFLCALSVSSIIFDRRLRMYAMFAPVYLALATALYLCLEQTVTKRSRLLRWLWQRIGIHAGYAVLSGILFAIGLATHQLTATLVFSTAAYLLWAGVMQYRQTGVWKNRSVVFLGIGVVALVLLSLVARNFLTSFTSGLIWFDDHYSYFGYVMTDYAHPLLAVLLMGFGAYSLAVRERNTRAAGYLVFSYLIPLACAIWFFRRNAGPQYIFFAQSFGIILVAAGILGLWESLRERFVGWGRRTAWGVLFLLVMLVPNFGYFFEENNTYHETSSGDNPNYRKVFAYVTKNRLPTDVLVTRNFRNYYWSGAKIHVYDLGDELNRERLSAEALEQILRENESGWVILSENDYDYFSNEAEALMKQRMERVSHPSVRGSIDVYRFGS